QPLGRVDLVPRRAGGLDPEGRADEHPSPGKSAGEPLTRNPAAETPIRNPDPPLPHTGTFLWIRRLSDEQGFIRSRPTSPSSRVLIASTASASGPSTSAAASPAGNASSPSASRPTAIRLRAS